jgi:hypothetical protein
MASSPEDPRNTGFLGPIRKKAAGMIIGEPVPRAPCRGKGDARHGLVGGTPVGGFVPRLRVHVTPTHSKAGSEPMAGRTGCLSWARPDLWEPRGAIPEATRPYPHIPWRHFVFGWRRCLRRACRRFSDHPTISASSRDPGTDQNRVLHAKNSNSLPHRRLAQKSRGVLFQTAAQCPSLGAQRQIHQ